MSAEVKGEVTLDVPTGYNLHQYEETTRFSTSDRLFLAWHPVYGTNNGFTVVDFTVSPPVKHEHTPEGVTIKGVKTEEPSVLILPSGSLVIPIRK